MRGWVILSQFLMNSATVPVKTTSLEKVLSHNQEVDWRTYDLYSETKLSSLSWKGIGKQKAATIELLKGYQRLLRLVGTDNGPIAIGLLRKGVHSALQIAAMARTQFISEFKNLWPDSEESAEIVYQRALQVRSKLLLEYMKIKQNSYSPISNARKA